MIRFLALLPVLLALLAHLGSASGTDLETCLPHAISEESRRFLLDGGRELPLGVWALDWASGWLTAWIFKILASEVLGFRTVLSSGVTSYTAAYALAGCKAPRSFIKDAQCEGAASTEFHVGLEAWMNVLDGGALSAVRALVGSRRMPLDLGSIGYQGQIFFSLTGETFQRAWNEQGVALDYYRSYNRTWQDPSAFFLPGSDISTSELQPCAVTRITRSFVLQGYLAATGDEDGVIRQPDGQLAPRCFDGVWWRSPACRDSPEKCVPLITGGDGYDLQFLMSSTSRLGMPVQLATAARGLWETLPLRGRGTLFYWWFPDKTFATLDARHVILPPHNPDEWDRGVQATTGSEIRLGKLAASNLEALAPQAFSLLKSFSLSSPRITGILEEHVSSGRTYQQSACAWLRANEDVWKPWLPLDTACSAGEGVVDSAGHFVDNISLAVSCKRCDPGCFSDFLGSGAALSYLCRSCPAGSFSNHFGATECEQCPPGTRSAEPVLAHPGHLRGSDTCTRCPLGTFQPAYGSSACLDCAVWLLGAETPFEGAEHASDCRCPEGSHRQRGAPGQPHRCVACNGLLCPAGLAVPQQAAGFFAREAPVVEERDAELLRLSDGAAGGLVLSVEPKMIKCKSLAKCPAGLALGHCPLHQQLLACEGCEAGYVWQGASCEECSGGDWVRIATAAAVAAVAGVAAVYVGTRLSLLGYFDSRAFLTSLGLAVHCLQAVSSISNLGVEWVEPMASLKSFLRVLNLDISILRIGCFFQTNSVVLEFVAGLILPLYFVVVVLVAFGISHLTRRRVKRSHVFNALGSTMMVLFLSMATAAFVPFQCIDNPDGTASVRSIRSVICWRGTEHATLLGLAVVATLLYVALPLAAVAAVTAQYARRMVQPGWQEFSARWRFAFSRFTRRCYYFGIFYMLRNLAIAVIPLTFANSTQVQILLLVGITALSVSVQSLMQPWCTRLANVLDTATSLLLITILLGSAMLLPGLDDGEISVLQVVFMLVTAGICLVCASPVIWIVLQRATRRDQYAFFLTHFKDEAACRARYWKLVISTNFPRSRVFLDSDNLRDLDALFEAAARTRCLVVIVTPGVLTRPWCAGEIAVAHQNQVPLVPIVFGTPWPPSSESIESALAGLGPQGTEILAGKGISLVQIRDAYRALSAASPVLVEAHSECSYDRAIRAMLGVCDGRALSRDGRALSPPPSAQSAAEDGGGVAAGLRRQPSLSDVDVGLLASSEDPEAVAARGIVSRMLQARSLGAIEAFAAGDEGDGRGFRSVVVLLSGGALRDPGFAASVKLAVDLDLPIIPVKVHKDFEFPDTAFYQQLEAGLVFGPNAGVAPEDLAGARLAYERLFKIISVTLSPSAPMPVLEAEVQELCGRLRVSRTGSWRRPSIPGTVSAVASSISSAVKVAEQPRTPGSEDSDPPQQLTVLEAAAEAEEMSKVTCVKHERVTL